VSYGQFGTKEDYGTGQLCRACYGIVALYRIGTVRLYRIGTVRYHWPMSTHASQAFSIASCTDSEDLPSGLTIIELELVGALVCLAEVMEYLATE